MRKSLAISVLALLTIGLAGCTSTTSNGGSTTSSTATSQPAGAKTLSEGGFTAVVTPTDTGRWTYVITGDVATPCHELKIDAVVAESYPEQVSLQVSVVAPDSDVVCAQVITTKKAEGAFTASDQASIKLVVK